MVNARQQARVLDYIAKGKAEGAKVEMGGDTPEGPGCYVSPTLFSGVNNQMTIAREETFGPVAPIIKISSIPEAIAIANSSKLGLIASLWTRDLATAWRVGEALQHGSLAAQ